MNNNKILKKRLWFISDYEGETVNSFFNNSQYFNIYTVMSNLARLV